MEQNRKRNPDGNDGGQSWKSSGTSYSTYAPLPGTTPPTNLPSQNLSDPNKMQSTFDSHGSNVSQSLYGASHTSSHPYPGLTGQPGNSTHFTSSLHMDPTPYWPSPSYGKTSDSPSYNPRSDLAMGRDVYAYGPTFPDPVSGSLPPTTQESWMTGEDIAESRRPTITQEIQNEINREAPSLPFNTIPGLSQLPHRAKESSNDTFGGHNPGQSRGVDGHRFSNIRNTRQSQAPYQQTSRRGLSRPTSLSHPSELTHPRYSASHHEGESIFASAVPGGIAIPQAPLMDSFRQSNVQGGGHYYPPRDTSPFSRSLPARSPHYDWPYERLGSSAATPSSTDGSADPAQSDQDTDEYEPRASISTSPSTSTSAAASSSTASRWARFRVPPDIFTNPLDPVRHELYHQIRQEDWFRNQGQERPITAGEASRIPGSIPGESVLLAFYDRITDSNGKTVMRCTICMNTNPAAQMYPRPDRAKVHMRHHFELRPIPCNAKCDLPNCMQRFFTMGDLAAHVAGKTEPLATCEHCRKPMRAKNLKRHVTHFCHRAPVELRSNRRA